MFFSLELFSQKSTGESEIVSLDLRGKRISQGGREIKNTTLKIPNLEFTWLESDKTPKKGNEILVLPSNKKAKIKDIILYKENLKKASKGNSITITLDREIDISRGDIICDSKKVIDCADQFNVNMIWMSNNPGLNGRTYIGKINTQKISIKVLFFYKINHFFRLLVGTVYLFYLVYFSTIPHRHRQTLKYRIFLMCLLRLKLHL